MPVPLLLHFIFSLRFLLCPSVGECSEFQRHLLLFIQVYKDRNIVVQLLKRAERAGFKAIVLTVDTPILGRREADIKNRYASHLMVDEGLNGIF